MTSGHKISDLNSIHLLRAVAAISIAAEHVNRITELYLKRNLHFSPPRYGDWGIDLFFVISGFVIFHVHKKDFGQPKKLKSYLIKRFLRIYPLYWITTLLLIPVFFIFKDIGSGYERDFDVIVKSLLLVPQTHAPILFPGWTLVHEIRFYLIFGLFIFINKSWAKILAIFLTCATMLEFYLKPAGYSNLNPQDLNTYLFSFFNIEFLLGVAGAYLIFSKSSIQKICLITTAFLYLLFLRFNFYGPFILENRVIMLGVPFAFIITLLAIFENKHSFRIPAVLLFLAGATYSIYLTHYLFTSVFMRLVINSGLKNSNLLPLVMLLVLLLSICGGCLVFRLIERPLSRYLKTKLS